MSRRYKGSVVSVTEPTTNSASAAGIWLTNNVMQGLQAGTWPLLAIPMEYLVLAGGGAGAPGNSGNIGNGGGGAGGLLNSTANFSYNTAYTFTVGAGATGPVAGLGNVGPNGSNSSITGTGVSLTAIGGGSAKAYISSGGVSSSGGCGGGGSFNTVTAGSGTAGPPRQGYDGGAGSAVAASYNGGGGGGTGTAGAISSGGVGGNGTSVSIMGSAITYGGGGGGGSMSGSFAGGSGGGGAGGINAVGTAGSTNLGGGGGGTGGTTGSGANGGSGVIIIAYPNTYPNAASVNVGLTVNGGAGNTTPDTTSRVGYKIYRITAGTGTISW